jgi:hypothetical protein
MREQREIIMAPSPATNSSYISITDLQNATKFGCQCEICKNMRQQSQQHHGKPICTIEELKQMQDEDRRAQENKQKIQIIKNKWCVCQRCGAHIRMLPETQPTQKE